MKRRFRRRPSRGQIVAVVLVSFVLLRLLADFFSPDPFLIGIERIREGSCDLVRVVDGDTIIVRQAVPRGEESSLADSFQSRVRLLGTDTPEPVKPNQPVERWQKEATEFTTRFLSGGKMRLRFDKQRKDDDDRLLAYVYVDDRLLNEELVRAGLARVSTYPGNSLSIARRLRDAQYEARNAKRGVWSEK